MYDIPVPGTNRFVETVSLGDRRLLSDLTDGDISPKVRWNNNPEFVCFVICRLALGDDCTYFTYDGLDADRCGQPCPTAGISTCQYLDIPYLSTRIAKVTSVTCGRGVEFFFFIGSVTPKKHGLMYLAEYQENPAVHVTC